MTEEIHAETLAGGAVVYADAAHPITTDALLLAAFCPLRPAWRVCDLGCGGGVLLLSLAGRGHTGPALGLDADDAGLALLRAAAQAAGLSNIETLKADWREAASPRPFDMVVCNPPYFSAGPASPQPLRARARHAPGGALPGACKAAARLLKDRGRLCLCWPAEGLAGLFAALAAAGLAPKRLRLARKAPAARPWLALIEARKGGGEGLAILPDLLARGQ